MQEKQNVQELLRIAKQSDYFASGSYYSHGIVFDEDAHCNTLVARKETRDEALLAQGILELIDDDVVALALHQVYGLGNKPNTTSYRKLQAFRASDKASLLYSVWQGKDYTPPTTMLPNKRRIFNHGSITVYHPGASIKV